MRTIKNLLVFAVFTLMASNVFAQGSVKGSVVDAKTNEALPGADVVVVGTTKGVATDFDGKFVLSVPAGAQKINISYVGYEPLTLSINVSNGQTKDLGTVALTPNAASLDEVVIVGTGVIDLAKDRKTPIAVSTLKAAEIQEKVGNFDLPDLLTTTPSVQAMKGGGYGGGSMYLRGFDQTNTAFLLNGQPINGMEDGKMYWSNWSGVLDIANAVQVQRGLGSSKLAISSVGGTVNIVTKTVDKKQGGFVSAMIANDNYMKGTAYYSTGIMKNGLAVAAMFGHWQGDGYRNGTPGQGQTYFFSLGYKPNEKHIFNFLVTGAPQWHGDAWTKSLSAYIKHEEGARFNPYYGYRDGKLYPGLRNFYHKPIINLSWDFNLNETSKISTVLYGSIGRGGYAYMEKAAWGLVDSDKDGGMDFDSLVALNKSQSDGNAKGFMKGSYNGHNWYGLVTNFETELSDNISFNIGGDVRMYNGQHFRGVVDFMGADHYDTHSTFSGNYSIDNNFGGYDPWQAVFNFNNDHKQRYSYDYEEYINYYGVFTQLEYSKDKFSSFIQGAISNQSHQVYNYFNYPEVKKSEKISNLGYNLKGGLAYKLDDHNTTFVNAGYYSRQPFHDDIFQNLRKSVDVDKYANKNQTITGLELGHNINYNKFKMGINLYYTQWLDRTHTSIVTDDTDPNNIKVYDIQKNGINEIHKGVEMEFNYRPFRTLQLKGFTSIGDWKYGKEPTIKVFDDATGDDITSTYTGYLPGSYNEGDVIGGAAQFTAGFGLDYEFIKGFRFNAYQKYYDKLFSLGGIPLPAYSLVDAGLTYKIPLGKNKIKFRLNVNNVFDKFYIEFSKDGPLDTLPTETWRGVDMRNNVSIGYGRTWNFGVKYMF